MKIGYDKAVSKIEKFMKDSGIRNICSNYCMGHCCDSCYGSEEACHKNEGRRLACSFYLCYSLRQLLLTKYEEKIFSAVDRIIKDKIRMVIRIRTGIESYTYPNIYFKVNNQSVRDKFSIDINVLNRLNKIDINEVHAKATALCELYSLFLRGRKEANK